MYKVCKIRIYPNQTQKRCIRETLGACRYVYNLYLEYNQRHYKENKEFLSGYDFAKILTKIKKNEERYEWLQGISTKALKDAIMNAEKAYIAFFKKKRGRPPRFRSRKDPFQSFFFIRDNIHFYPNTPEKKNVIKLPILGYTRITEKSYLPNKRDVISGRVIYQKGKYYVLLYMKQMVLYWKKKKNPVLVSTLVLSSMLPYIKKMELGLSSTRF